MNKLLHVVTQVDEAQGTATCAVCGVVRVYLKGNGWVCGRLPPRSNKRHGPSKGSGAGAKLTHLLTDVDEVTRTATCARCGPVRVYEAKGTRARVGQRWTCGRRPPERAVGGTPTAHQISNVDEVSRTGTCAICGPIKLVWRPYKRGGGTWGCFRTRFSISSFTAYKWSDDFKPAICPICNLTHRWDRGPGRACREKLHALFGTHCNVCSAPPVEEPLRVDHDHHTGKVRGLLCRSCNVALGLLQDEPSRVEKLLTYIQQTGT